MTFKEYLQIAGFHTKKDFSEYIGRTRESVINWGEDPPLWALRILELKIEIMEDVQALAEKWRK